MMYLNTDPDCKDGCKPGGGACGKARGKVRILSAARRFPPASLLPVLFPVLFPVLLAVLASGLAGCRGHVEGRLETPPRAMRGAGKSPPGIFFLHDWSEGAEGCLYLGERTGGAESPAGARGRPRLRSQAVLQLAGQTRMLGGNVVMLPRFSAEYPQGVLTGQVYRCGEAERERLYQQGAAEERLTVIE